MTDKEQQVNDSLQDIAKDIEKKLPDNMGFTLLAYEFGDTADRKMLYISNSDRASVLKAMAEFLNTQLDNPDIFGKDV